MVGPEVSISEYFSKVHRSEGGIFFFKVFYEKECPMLSFYIIEKCYSSEFSNNTKQQIRTLGQMSQE